MRDIFERYILLATVYQMRRTVILIKHLEDAPKSTVSSPKLLVWHLLAVRLIKDSTDRKEGGAS